MILPRRESDIVFASQPDSRDSHGFDRRRIKLRLETIMKNPIATADGES
jgi:hypothetical protein